MPRDAKYAMAQVQPCPTRIRTYMHDYSPPECLNASHRRGPSSEDTLHLQSTLYVYAGHLPIPPAVCFAGLAHRCLSLQLRIFGLNFGRAMNFDCI